MPSSLYAPFLVPAVAWHGGDGEVYGSCKGEKRK